MNKRAKKRLKEALEKEKIERATTRIKTTARIDTITLGRE